MSMTFDNFIKSNVKGAENIGHDIKSVSGDIASQLGPTPTTVEPLLEKTYSGDIHGNGPGDPKGPKTTGLITKEGIAGQGFKSIKPGSKGTIGKTKNTSDRDYVNQIKDLLAPFSEAVGTLPKQLATYMKGYETSDVSSGDDIAEQLAKQYSPNITANFSKTTPLTQAENELTSAVMAQASPTGAMSQALGRLGTDISQYAYQVPYKNVETAMLNALKETIEWNNRGGNALKGQSESNWPAYLKSLYGVIGSGNGTVPTSAAGKTTQNAINQLRSSLGISGVSGGTTPTTPTANTTNPSTP